MSTLSFDHRYSLQGQVTIDCKTQPKSPVRSDKVILCCHNEKSLLLETVSVKKGCHRNIKSHVTATFFKRVVG